jgi:hypothetical protein
MARRSGLGISVTTLTTASLLAAALMAVTDVPATATPSTTAATSRPLVQLSRDINGDGYDDAVVGDPYATVAGKKEAGSITVLFGDSDGRVGEGGRRVLNQGSMNGSAVEAGDHFGWSVTIGNATSQARPQILVGSPGEDWKGHTDAGIAHIISIGATVGQTPGTVHAYVLSQETTGGALESGDQFGSSVAISNIGHDVSTGAVGAPGEDVGSLTDAGAVNEFNFDQGVKVGGKEWRQGQRGVPGTAQAGDGFGAALLFAKLYQTSMTGRQPLDDTLVIGAPGDTVSGHRGAGSVTCLDSEGGVLTSPRAHVYTQDSNGFPGAAEAGDQFGYSLATDSVAYDESRAHQLVIGVPGEDLGTRADAGAVVLFVSMRYPYTVAEMLTQDRTGVPGVAEAGDRFGYALAMQARTSETSPRFIVSAPYDDIGTAADAGLVQAFTSDGSIIAAGTQYTESSPGTPGTLAAHNHFGSTLSALTGRSEAPLTMSSVHQGDGSVFVLSGSTSRSWVPGKGGIPAEHGGRFGWSLAGD